LIYLGALVLDAQVSITALTVLLVAIGTPWAVVVGIGLIACRGVYLDDDLQVFNRGQRGGAYWFTEGWNPRAAIAWLVGASFGALAVNTTLYKGPLADIADGVDISFLGAGAIAGAVYLVLRALFPEHRAAEQSASIVEDRTPPVPELGPR
jgi:cytosine/uracil/thiamine/allantoin permease